MTNPISVQTLISAPIENVWNGWITPKHIEQWNHANEDWYCPKAENNFVIEGRFCYTMASKDGAFSFDFMGKYDDIVPLKSISITLDDNRKIQINFSEEDKQTRIIELFEAENENSRELQEAGWQAILTNFKNYIESI